MNPMEALKNLDALCAEAGQSRGWHRSAELQITILSVALQQPAPAAPPAPPALVPAPAPPGNEPRKKKGK